MCETQGFYKVAARLAGLLLRCKMGVSDAQRLLYSIGSLVLWLNQFYVTQSTNDTKAMQLYQLSRSAFLLLRGFV
jgi:hypothetical protein